MIRVTDPSTLDLLFIGLFLPYDLGREFDGITQLTQLFFSFFNCFFFQCHHLILYLIVN